MTVNTPDFPPLFIINLERSSDRRCHISSQLDALGLQYEFFTATDGAKLTGEEFAIYDESFVTGKIRRPLSLPEIGCYLSHIRLWQKIVDNEISWAVILEDDVEIHHDFKCILAAINTIPFKWDLIRLSGLQSAPSLPLYDLCQDHTISVPLQPTSGTQGVCVSYEGLKKLLAYAGPTIRGTLDDHAVDKAWKAGLRILAVQPYPVSEDRKLASSIESERRETCNRPKKKPSLLTLKAWLAVRRYKMSHSVERRAYFAIHALFWLQNKARLRFTRR